jgi:hypothetical protein
LGYAFYFNTDFDIKKTDSICTGTYDIYQIQLALIKSKIYFSDAQVQESFADCNTQPAF